jgi:class 3 adenylate cyclase
MLGFIETAAIRSDICLKKHVVAMKDFAGKNALAYFGTPERTADVRLASAAPFIFF